LIARFRRTDLEMITETVHSYRSAIARCRTQ